MLPWLALWTFWIRRWARAAWWGGWAIFRRWRRWRTWFWWGAWWTLTRVVFILTSRPGFLLRSRLWLRILLSFVPFLILFWMMTWFRFYLYLNWVSLLLKHCTLNYSLCLFYSCTLISRFWLFSHFFLFSWLIFFVLTASFPQRFNLDIMISLTLAFLIIYFLVSLKLFNFSGMPYCLILAQYCDLYVTWWSSAVLLLSNTLLFLFLIFFITGFSEKLFILVVTF